MVIVFKLIIILRFQNVYHEFISFTDTANTLCFNNTSILRSLTEKDESQLISLNDYAPKHM